MKKQLCGSCVAYATMGALEAALIKAGADPDSVDLSEQWVMDCSPRSKDNCRQGLLYRWTEHSILSLATGGGKQCLIMLHKLTQSL